jgi:hypothetical protein
MMEESPPELEDSEPQDHLVPQLGEVADFHRGRWQYVLLVGRRVGFEMRNLLVMFTLSIMQ